MSKRSVLIAMACIVIVQLGMCVLTTVVYFYYEALRGYNNACSVRWLIDERVLDTPLLDTKPTRVALPGATIGPISGLHPLDQGFAVTTELLEDGIALPMFLAANMGGLMCSGLMIVMAICLRVPRCRP